MLPVASGSRMGAVLVEVQAVQAQQFMYLRIVQVAASRRAAANFKLCKAHRLVGTDLSEQPSADS